MKKLIITSSLILILGLFSCKKETVTSTLQEEIVTGKPPTSPPSASILQWQKCVGTSTDDFGNAVAKTHDGNGYFVAGTTGPLGSHDVIVSKIGLNGAPIWQTPTIVGGSLNDEAYGVVATPDGGCLVAGIGSSIDGDLAGLDNVGNGLLIKISSSGSKEWVKKIGGGKINALIKTSDEKYALTGYNTPVNGTTGFWLVKFDFNADGPVIEWQKTIGDPDNISRHGYSLAEAANGGFIIAGTVYTDPAPDIWIINTDDLGNVNWTKRISSGVGADVAFGVTANTTGYLVTGYLSSSNLIVAKLKLDGSNDWQKTFSAGSATGSIRGRSVISTSEGDIIVGTTNSRNGSIIASKGSDDLFVLRLDDANGDTLGSPYVLGGKNSEAGYGVIPTAGGYIAVGSTSSNNGDVLGNNGGSDMWVVKFKF